MSIEMQTSAVIAPMLIAAVGTLLSIAGVFIVRTKKGLLKRSFLNHWAWV
jgi:K(+)-stimulated pyrophosphate-energized sodium pump